MVKTLKKDFIISVLVPNGLLKDQQACQINAIKTIFYNIQKTKVEIEYLKNIFEHDEMKGSSCARYNFQRFNNYLLMERIPYRSNIGHFDDITSTFQSLSQKLPVAVYFGMEVLKKVEEKIPSEFKFNAGENVYYDENRHILLLVGYMDGGEKLLFLDPVYQLPFLEGQRISGQSQLIALSWKEAFQHYKPYNSYIDIIFDHIRAKRFDKESKKKQMRLI